MRAIDRVCRWGGEEIADILPDTDTALDMAERLRAEVGDTPFGIGVAAYPRDADSVDALVTAADTAMYVAKQGGRNRVCQYESPGKAG